MLVRPISINGNPCKEFNARSKEEISVIAGGYIITPVGEIIEVRDSDEHRKIFSSYINSYLEKKDNEIYDTLTATKILCELGCCVYAGIRLEYIKNKLDRLENCLGSLTFPSDIENITPIQKEICLSLIETNKSIFGNKEKIMIQYGSFPDNVYSKDQALSILNQKKDEKNI